MFSRNPGYWCLGAAVAVSALFAAMPVSAQEKGFSDCVGTVFSTEEDFVSPIGKAADGSPIVSDGDLLALNPTLGGVTLCARNRDLLRPGVLVEVEQDLGLDAVDAILPQEGVIAFSTELDERFGLFGHGDILFPNGTVIPNAVLTHRFQLPTNVGLDAIHFVGREAAILEAISLARELGREKLMADPETYLGRLKELRVDIWFSIEGTSPSPQAPQFLDGDLLSALNGTKVAGNGTLLQAPIPGGLPKRGVDFGLDAVTADRRGNRESIQFSTELLYRGGKLGFTDGDILAIGGAINLPHETLIRTLEARADFLGLDALSLATVDEARPHIDSLCGDAFNAIDFGSDGLWRANLATSPPGTPPRRPCGLFVPVGGTLPPGLNTPTGTITRLRVTYESLDASLPSPFTGGIETSWRLRTPHPVFPWLCAWHPTLRLSTDADGWMDARAFVDAMTGEPTGITGNGSLGCANPHLRLAVWDSLGLPDDRENDLMRLRLEWETTGSVTPVASAYAYTVQLDNKLPELPPYPANLEVRLNDGSLMQVPACGEAPSGASVFQVWSEFDDPYYWFFTLTVEGGDPPITHGFASPSGDGRHAYFETPDGPGPVGPVKNTDDTGTVPNGSLALLRTIDLSELGASFQRCCYLLELKVYDAAIRHSFNGINPSSSVELNRRRVITTFAAGS